MVLDKIVSYDQKCKLMAILNNPHPLHPARLWLVGFLNYAGYDLNALCAIIRDYAHWLDYDEYYTRYQIISVINSAPSTTGTHKHAEYSIDDLIAAFSRSLPTPKMNVPSDIRAAARYYYDRGYTVLPKHPDRKTPNDNWKKYQSTRASIEETMSWDWSYGICLLAGNGHNFLDIDKRSQEHPDGVDSFDASILEGRHYERTPSGGIHIFGNGDIHTANAPGGELKGMGSLIVAYPTTGYTLP